MSLEQERHLCQAWRRAATFAQPPHVVETCQCWACNFCRACEGVILEVDRLTGADGVGSGGVPGGV
jgi:hypothetical protein